MVKHPLRNELNSVKSVVVCTAENTRKIDLHWRLEVFLSQAPTSNESYIGLPNGNVMKTRSVNIIAQSGRWNSKMILAVQCNPDKPTVTHQDLDFDSVETSANPHANADAGADPMVVPEGDADHGEEARKRAPTLNRQVRITKNDVDNIGYEPCCPRRDNILMSAGSGCIAITMIPMTISEQQWQAILTRTKTLRLKKTIRLTWQIWMRLLINLTCMSSRQLH